MARETLYTNTINKKDPNKRNHSPIKRSKFGVGKHIGGEFYFHKNYIKRFPYSYYDKALEILHEKLPDFEFNCLTIPEKLDDAQVHYVKFINCVTFDSNREPLRGEGYTVNADTGEIKKMLSPNSIWHHKWVWVDDDYQGFNVDDSYKWSKEWLSKLDRPAFGVNQQGWNDQLSKHNLPIEEMKQKIKEALDFNLKKFKEINDLSLYPDDSDWDGVDTIPNDSERQSIASDKTSVDQIPRTMRNDSKNGITWSNNEKGHHNLDIGGGRYDNGTNSLKGMGVTNYILDPYNRTSEHNQAVIDKIVELGGADTVTVNNCLNVIQGRKHIENVIHQAATAVKKDGKVIFQIYKRNGDGIAGPTKQGFQQNKKASAYVPLIHQFFNKIFIHDAGNCIIASEPLPKSENPALFYTSSDDKGQTIQFQNEGIFNNKKGKKVIRLTEADLHTIIKNVLTEKFKKHYSSIDYLNDLMDSQSTLEQEYGEVPDDGGFGEAPLNDNIGVIDTYQGPSDFLPLNDRI